MFRLNFKTRVLGRDAAISLRHQKVTQTIRSQNSDIIKLWLEGNLQIGDKVEVALDDQVIDYAYPFIIKRVAWRELTIKDAQWGGFRYLYELKATLMRAGYRFKPLDDYPLYKVMFQWYWR